MTVKQLKKLIIIPAFNESETLHALIREIKQQAPDFDYIIINDGSTDDTADLCDELDLNALHIPINLGIGAAMQAGYTYAWRNNYDIAVQLDGDGQHDPAELNRLIVPIITEGCDIVIGSRFIEKKGFQSSLARRTGITFLSNLIHLLTGRKFYDVTSGLRACNRSLIHLFSKIYPEDFPETESLMMLIMLKRKIKEIAVTMRERMGGVSSIDWLSSLYFMTKVTLSLIVMRIRSTKNICNQGII